MYRKTYETIMLIIAVCMLIIAYLTYNAITTQSGESLPPISAAFAAEMGRDYKT